MTQWRARLRQGFLLLGLTVFWSWNAVALATEDGGHGRFSYLAQQRPRAARGRVVLRRATERVHYTGAQVKRGQILFTLCSPDLVATQQEYLLAVKGKRTLGGSPFPEAAGAFATFLVTLFADEPET